MPHTRDAPWTARDVELWLRAAYGTDPRLRSPGVASAMAWPALYNPVDQDARIAVHLWAYWRSRGEHIGDAVAGRGWSLSSFERWRARGIARITAGLNGERERYRASLAHDAA